MSADQVIRISPKMAAAAAEIERLRRRIRTSDEDLRAHEAFFDAFVEALVRAEGPPLNEGHPARAVIDYLNHRGERAMRPIIPLSMQHNISSYHPHHWVLVAYDLDKKEERCFSMAGIRSFSHGRIVREAAKPSAKHTCVDDRSKLCAACPKHTCDEGRGSMGCTACGYGIPYDWSQHPGKILADKVLKRRKKTEKKA